MDEILFVFTFLFLCVKPFVVLNYGLWHNKKNTQKKSRTKYFAQIGEKGKVCDTKSKTTKKYHIFFCPPNKKNRVPLCFLNNSSMFSEQTKTINFFFGVKKNYYRVFIHNFLYQKRGQTQKTKTLLEVKKIVKKNFPPLTKVFMYFFGNIPDKIKKAIFSLYLFEQTNAILHLIFFGVCSHLNYKLLYQKRDNNKNFPFPIVLVLFF